MIYPLCRANIGDDGYSSDTHVLGTVFTPDGRLITFPNVIQRRINACGLIDCVHTMTSGDFREVSRMA